MTPQGVRFCEQCGVKMLPGGKFCEKCGTRSSAAPTMTASPAGSAASQSIGPYRILRELGRGGMGVVYLAIRDDGTFRKNVALKLLLEEHVTPEFVQRFKQERQVLAALDHPHIARILDGGDAPSGFPYYVMEYVEGCPVDEYCAQQRLVLPARIKIFQQVCEAVHYLHQNSIVHRDLKPSNVLVSSDGVAKLLDFGIAKMTGAAALATPELTGVMGRPMTPSYASPEQFDGATLRKTSDIYSLGAILYLLLTGRSPYLGLDDKMAKFAARQEPPLPSSNIREDLKGNETTAQLRRAMLGELDSIVLKALRIDPKDRYQSAADLSGDLQHFLDGTPVTAHHASLAGRSVRMLKRKRAMLAVLAAFLLVAAFGGWQWWRYQGQKTEVAAREKQLRGAIDQLEARLKSTSLAGSDAAQASEQLADVRKLEEAFASFPGLAARMPENSPERNTLLDRGIEYLDRVRPKAGSNNDLSLEVSDAYHRLAVLQESAAGVSGRASALKTYQKAAGVLASAEDASPGDSRLRDRLVTINIRIQALGGATVRVSGAGPPPPPVEAQEVAAPLPRRISAPQPRAAIETRRPAAAASPLHAGSSAVELAEAQERLIGVSARAQIAEQTVAPIRQNLERQGQTLSADTLAALSRMQSTLARAKRELAAGNAAEANENLSIAEGLATKVLRSVGR